MESTPHPSESVLRSLIEGNLSPDEASAAAHHLDSCTACQSLAERLTEVPREFWAALLINGSRRQVHSSLPAPMVPGYTRLRELGRGGHGVVYRAREEATNREVVLKLLRAGVLASPADYRRFQAEARTAANLRHPNIVTVLGVGEVDGLPYYVMEYLPARSLANRLNGTPLPPREAAALVETVARAVHYAHSQGVIHRDLKPGNILIDGPADSVRLGVPKVSDFGMAKFIDYRISENPGLAKTLLTPTVSILGTPNYMAPEQAFGHSQDVGPGADVYALGAILYDLLTGRPPFQGTTPYETLIQVRNDDPIELRRLWPGLPKDLETVCLKCLEKDPRRRYPTAEALADDLIAFLEGRPVTARPIGWSGRLARWCRREPTVAALSGLSLALLLSGLVAITLLWRRAEARGAEARVWAGEAERRQSSAMAALRFYSDAADKLFRNPGLVSREERDALVQALEFYEGLLTELAGAPDEEDRAAYAMLQLSGGLHNLGELQSAVRISTLAVDVLHRLSNTHPNRDDFQNHYADGCSQLGGLLNAIGNKEESFHFRKEAVRVGEALVARHPDRDHYRGCLAAYEATLAGELEIRGQLDAAESLFRRSVDENRRLIKRYPEDPMRYEYFKVASHSYASFLLRHRHDLDQFWELAWERMELCDLARSQPNWPRIAQALLNGETSSELERANQHHEADKFIARGIAFWQELAKLSPPLPDAERRLAQWLEAQRQHSQPARQAKSK